MTRAGEFLRAIFREDWESSERLAGEMERNKESPATITGFAFSHAVKDRFEPDKSMRDVIHFVADARTDLLAGRDLSPREAEALICAALDIEEPGVEQIIDNLDVDTIVSIETQLLYKLITARQMSDEELDHFIANAERSAAEWSTAG
jgi:hypothetical protein